MSRSRRKLTKLQEAVLTVDAENDPGFFLGKPTSSRPIGMEDQNN